MLTDRVRGSELNRERIRWALELRKKTRRHALFRLSSKAMSDHWKPLRLQRGERGRFEKTGDGDEDEEWINKFVKGLTLLPFVH